MTEDEGMEYACPECGEMVPADAKYCPSCEAVFEEDGNEEGAAAAKGVGGRAGPATEGGATSTRKAKTYVGGLGLVGLLFLALAVVAIVGTVVVMNWDVWVGGAAKETVGDRQRAFIYLGLLGFFVCVLVTGFDLLRGRK